MTKKHTFSNLSSDSARKKRSMEAVKIAVSKRTKINLEDRKRRLKEWKAWI